jgi:hypothetical protein
MKNIKLLSWWMHNENNVNGFSSRFMSHGIWEVHEVRPVMDDENYYTMRLIMPMHHHSKLYETTELSESTLLQIAHRVEIKHYQPELVC